ncbi:hypothetical protein G7054_g12134 [Neopestalotiopsis clavispora]|nr:hypothetical protein G7054_g12134 [Neopestalotiopsis clavispora]
MDSHCQESNFFDDSDLPAGTFGLDYTDLFGAPTWTDSSLPFAHDAVGGGPCNDLPGMPTQLAPGQLTTKPLLPQRPYTTLPSEQRPRRPSFGTDPLAFPVTTAPAPEAIVPREGKSQLAPGMMPKMARKKPKKKEQLEDNSDDDAEEPSTASFIVNPQDWYGRPTKSPKPWGWRKRKGGCTFQYNELGEFEYNVTFSRKDLQAYFDGVPPKRHEDDWVARQILPGERIRLGKKRSGLTLWIGWTPAHANERYPSATYSNKCRWHGCPVPSRSFRGGFPRVAFDERMNVDGRYRDPYHVAGYMHLFCLEQHFDILKLMETVDVRLDTRVFIKEDNLAGFQTRADQQTKIKAACDWLSSEWSRKGQWDNYLYHLNEQRKRSGHLLVREQTVRPRHFDDSLTKKLVETDFNHYQQSGASSRVSRKQKGNLDGRKPLDAGDHLGNIEYMAAERRARSGKRAPKKGVKSTPVDRDDRLLRHRVYNAEHFTRGFVPGRQGPSGRDALGRRDRGSNPESFALSPVKEGTPEPPALGVMPQPPNPAPGSTLPGIDPLFPMDNHHHSVSTSCLPSTIIDQPLADFSQLLEGNQPLDGFGSTVPDVPLLPNSRSDSRPKRARENDLFDDSLDHLTPTDHRSHKRQRRITEWITSLQPLQLSHDRRSSESASQWRHLLPSQRPQASRRRRNSIQFGRTRTKTPEYIWSMPGAGPVLCRHRGESPVDFNAKYKTLSLKRKRDEENTQIDQGEKSPNTIYLENWQPMSKRIRTDAFLPSQLARQSDPNALTDMNFSISLANFTPDFNFLASDPNLIEQDLSVSDDQLHLLLQGIYPGNGNELESAYGNRTSDWFDEQLQLGWDLGADTMPQASSPRIISLDAEHSDLVKSEDAPARPVLDKDTNPDDRDAGSVELPSVAAVLEQQQEIADLEDSALDEGMNELFDFLESAEPSSETLPPLSSVLEDIQSGTDSEDDNHDNDENNDIDDLFNPDGDE